MVALKGIFVAISSILLTSCIVVAPFPISGSSDAVKRTDDAKVPVTRTVTSPTTIGNFVYTGSQIYPDKNLGCFLRYKANNNGVADVYIYPVPPALVNNSHAEIVRTMTTGALADIETLVKNGLYKSFSMIQNQNEVANHKTTAKIYGSLLTNTEEKALTGLYLTEDNGTVFKIRVTQPNAQLNNVQQDWDTFAHNIFSFLSQRNKTNNPNFCR